MTKVKDLIRKKRPIVVDIQSAVHLGLNDAIVLQQIHYWIDSNEEREIEHVFKQGQWWTYGTYEEWQKRDFPFWSVSTVKRAFLSLERRGAIRSATLNKYAGDRTKWYTLNYDADIDPVNDGTDQIDPMVTDQIESMEQTKLTHSNNKESKPKRVKRDAPPNGAVTTDVVKEKPDHDITELHRALADLYPMVYPLHSTVNFNMVQSLLGSATLKHTGRKWYKANMDSPVTADELRRWYAAKLKAARGDVKYVPSAPEGIRDSIDAWRAYTQATPAADPTPTPDPVSDAEQRRYAMLFVNKDTTP